MSIPTTVSEALSFSSKQAEEMMFKIDALVGEKMGEYDPGEEFDTREEVFALAHMIDVLNRVSQLPDNPFGPGGWISLIPEDQG